MKIYVGTSWSQQLIKESIKYGLGWITTPQDPIPPNRIPKEIPYILDNGAFRCWKRKTPWNEEEFYSCLETIIREPDFVVIPDIVAGGMNSYHHSLEHIDRIPYQKYLPVQDGMLPKDVIEGILRCDGIFVGGTLQWKWRWAIEWIYLAHQYGLKCHIGRVGTSRGYDRANQLCADSVDGTTPIRHNNLKIIPKWRKTEQEQIRLTHLLKKEEWGLQTEFASNNREMKG